MDPNPPQSLRKQHSARSIDILDAAASIPTCPSLHTQTSFSRPPTAWSEKTYYSPHEEMSLPMPTHSQQNLITGDNMMPDIWRDRTPSPVPRSGSAIILYGNGQWRHFDEPQQVSSFKQTPFKTGIAECDTESCSSKPTQDLPPSTNEKSTGPLAEGMSGVRQVLFVMTVCFAQLLSLAALSQTIAPVLIISKSLGVTDHGKMTWYTASFGLTLGGLILPAGRLGDMFGHRRIFVIGWLWFGLWSLVCGFSYLGGYNMLVASRAMQGIGPALLVPNGIALIGRTFPMGIKRNVSIACFGGCGPVGFIVGAAFSALCSEFGWWSWPFWALAVTCTVISLLSFFTVPADVLPRSPDPSTKWWEKYDLPGCATGVTGLVLVNFSFNQGAIVGWQESYIYFTLILGFISFAIFLYIELRIAAHPLIPIKGLHREAAFSLAIIACGWGSHGIWVYDLFGLMEGFRGLSALMAVAQSSAVAPVGLGCALAVVFVLRKVKVAWVMFVAMLGFTVGSALLATAPVKQSYWLNTFLSVVVMPLGMNWSFPAGCMLLSNAVAREHQGIAASLVSTMVNYSISTGLGMAGTVNLYVGKAYGPLAAWRSGLFFALALDGLGLIISGYFVWKSRARK